MQAYTAEQLKQFKLHYQVFGEVQREVAIDLFDNAIIAAGGDITEGVVTSPVIEAEPVADVVETAPAETTAVVQE